MPEFTPFMIWAATYLIHSTLLLGGVWIWFRVREPHSHALRETVWKLAASGGLLTCSLQIGLQIETPLNQILQNAYVSLVNQPANGLATSPVMTAFDEPAVASSNLPTFAHRLSRFERRDLTASSVEQPAFPERTDSSFLSGRSSADASADSQKTLIDATLVRPPWEPTFWQGQPASLSDTSRSFDPTPLSRTPLNNIDQRPPLSSTALGSGALREAGWVGSIQAVLLGLAAACAGSVVALTMWGLLRLLGEQRELRQRLQTCRLTTSGPARLELDRLLKSVRIRRSVQLMLDDQDLEPGACGWFRWKIIIPSRAVEVLSPAELRGLMAHELAHLVRGDQWWLLMGRILSICLGWQPLNRIALREWQRASEYLCDSWAIQREVPRLSLARCLTTVAEWKLSGLATVAGMGATNLSTLSRRVERLVDDKTPLADPWLRYSRRHIISAAAAIVATLMVGLAPAATWNSPRRSLSATPKLDAVHARASDPGPAADEHSTADATMSGTDLVATQPQLGTAVENHVHASHADPERAEIDVVLTTRTAMLSDGRITVQQIELVHRQVLLDLDQLARDLDSVRPADSVPGLDNERRWETRMRRIRERVEDIRRIHRSLLIRL